MNISVIIPTYNGGDRIGDLLSWLVENKSWFHEIILVDDGSDSPIVNPHPGIVMIHRQANQGRASARNTGAELASGKLLWFLDDDMKPTINSTEMITKHFEDEPRSILVGGQFENPDRCRSDFQSYKSYLSAKWQGALGSSRTKLEKPYITAANMVIQSALFSELGSFREELPDLEDFDLALRAFEVDIPIFFEPRLHAWHLPPADINTYINRLNEYEKVRRKLGYSTKPGRKIFSSQKWLDYIDADKLVWLPRFLRYRIYSQVIASHIQSK